MSRKRGRLCELPLRMGFVCGWALLAAVLGALVWTANAGAEESLAERRQRIEDMNPEQKEQLLRRQQRFAGLSSAEQEKLRQLHEQLEGDAHAAELRKVLHQYSKWLTTISSGDRAELLELPPTERLERIKKLKKEQQERQARIKKEKEEREAREAKYLTPKDFEELQSWVEEYAKRHEEEVLSHLPPDQRHRMDERPEAQRRGDLLWLIWQPGPRGGRPSLPNLTEEDLTQLRARLSSEARKRLDAASSPDERKQLIGNWVGAMFRNRMKKAWQSRFPMPKIDEQELAKFFEQVLSAEQRDQLLGLPGEEMQRELQRLYFQHLRPLGPPGPGMGPPGSMKGSRPRNRDNRGQDSRPREPDRGEKSPN
ncbi:MAG: hypothetical protein ACYC35_19840 [Pirellulales bacterium]